MFRQLLFLSCIILISFSSCRSYKQIEIAGVRGFQVNKINPEGIDGNIMLALKNPNPFSFSIYRSEFDVTYSGIYLGKAKLAKRVRIHANEEKVYSFNLKSSFTDVTLPGVMKLLSGATFKNLLEVKGDLRAGKFFIVKRLPVDVKEQVKLN